jgi:hypothetical protein
MNYRVILHAQVLDFNCLEQIYSKLQRKSNKEQSGYIFAMQFIASQSFTSITLLLGQETNYSQLSFI